ncbi:MAG TPA: hypothetical protein PKE39_04840 [Ignavibacteria bacterium]|nr:hypothetical protein [Ignavibacteria bacterium]HMQ98330.1 hypothetical protein [Ignavibacteria bacterium]
MSSPEEYKNNLLKFDLQSFLKEYSGLSSLQLKKKFPRDYKLLASQLSLYPKAVSKLPEFTSKYCYLTTKSYEQSSSEALAEYKASLFSGDLIIDLTGGLGIDDIAFSRKFRKVISVDTDAELNLLAEVNFEKLGIINIERITARAEEFIINNISANLVYIDADRRNDKSGKRTVTLHNASPDILKILDRLYEISPLILLKLSPLADITYLERSLKNIKEIRVISLANEVKEILVLLDRNFKGQTLIAAVEISKNGNIKEYLSGTVNKVTAGVNSKVNYFFEPSAGLIKSGLAGEYAVNSGLENVFDGSLYYTSAAEPKGLMGRSFYTIAKMPFTGSAFKKYLSDSKISQANISCRNFPLKPEDIRKNYKLKDGGEDYFFFTADRNNGKLFFHCRKYPGL